MVDVLLTNASDFSDYFEKCWKRERSSWCSDRVFVIQECVCVSADRFPEIRLYFLWVFMLCVGPFLPGLGASESKCAPLAVKFLSDTTVEGQNNNQPNHINTHTNIYLHYKHTHLHRLLTHLLRSSCTPASTHPLSPPLNSLTPPTCVLSSLPSAPTLAFPISPLIPPPHRLCADRSMSQRCWLMGCEDSALSGTTLSSWNTNANAHTHTVRCTHVSTLAHTCWSSPEFIHTNN